MAVNFEDNFGQLSSEKSMCGGKVYLVIIKECLSKKFADELRLIT